VVAQCLGQACLLRVQADDSEALALLRTVRQHISRVACAADASAFSYPQGGEPSQHGWKSGRVLALFFEPQVTLKGSGNRLGFDFFPFGWRQSAENEVNVSDDRGENGQET